MFEIKNSHAKRFLLVFRIQPYLLDSLLFESHKDDKLRSRQFHQSKSNSVFFIVISQDSLYGYIIFFFFWKIINAGRMSQEMLPLRHSRNSGSLEGTPMPEDNARCSVPNPLSSTETVEEELKKLEIGSSGEKIQSNDIPMEGACGGKDATPEDTSRDDLDSLDIPDNGDVDKSSKKKKKKKAKRSRQATASPGKGDPKSSDALLWENVKFFIRDTVVKQKIDGQKLSAERRISPDEFRSKFCLPDLANFLNKEEMLRQKENVDMEIERHWQDILDEVNVDLFTNVEIFKSQLTHAFDSSIAESGWKVSFNSLFIKRDCILRSSQAILFEFTQDHVRLMSDLRFTCVLTICELNNC